MKTRPPVALVRGQRRKKQTKKENNNMTTNKLKKMFGENLRKADTGIGYAIIDMVLRGLHGNGRVSLFSAVRVGRSAWTT